MYFHRQPPTKHAPELYSETVAVGVVTLAIAIGIVWAEFFLSAHC